MEPKKVQCRRTDHRLDIAYHLCAYSGQLIDLGHKTKQEPFWALFSFFFCSLRAEALGCHGHNDLRKQDGAENLREPSYQATGLPGCQLGKSTPMVSMAGKTVPMVLMAGKIVPTVAVVRKTFRPCFQNSLDTAKLWEKEKQSHLATSVPG